MPEKISLCSNWISKNIKDSAKKLKTPKLIKIYIPFPLKKNTKYKEQNKKTKKNTLAPPLKNPLAHLWKNEGVAPLWELLYSNPEFAKY